MIHTLFGLTALAYTVAAALYLTFLVRGHEAPARWATRALIVAVVGHVAFLTSLYVHLGTVPTADIQQALALLSLLVAVAFVVMVQVRERLRILGAFLTPLTLFLFLAAAFHHQGVGPLPPPVRSALVPLHVVVNVLGLTAFAMAFAAAVAYLLQERQLKQKNLGGLFQRLPSLNVLDTVGLRFVLIGFPLLTIGVVTGTIWAVRISPGVPASSQAQIFGILAWLLFAAVLLLRVAAGWRGRRAAIGTLLGFLSTVAVLVGYVLRGTA